MLRSAFPNKGFSTPRPQRLGGELSESLMLITSVRSLFDHEVWCQPAQKSWGAMGTPIQFGPLCLNEPCELPSEFMFWLFREESRDSKKVTFRLPRAPEGKKKVTLTRRASL
jgi:hypothetical protein